jgi:signal transduction histidine kinase
MSVVASRRAISPLATLLGLWRAISTERKLKCAVLVIVVGLTAHVCVTVGRYIEALLANKAAASSALYMDSFVEPLVQDLAIKATLSAESRRALETALAPATIGRPVVSFRIWVRDKIAFSSRGDLIGRQFAPTTARHDAFEGNVVARFGLDGDDDDDDRALGAPILEVYAPIRQTGTNRIIAIAETTELAINLSQEIRAAQYASYVAIVSTAVGLVLFLFKLTSGLRLRIGKLTKQEAEHAQFCRRVFRAHSRVLEMGERSLRNVSEQLHDGPLQMIALAQLSLGALYENPDRVQAEVEVLKKTLNDCARQIRDLSVGLAPSQLEAMSLVEVISTSVCLRDRLSVTADLQDLPQNVPYVMKSCVYQLLEQAIRSIVPHATEARVHVRAWSEVDKLAVELAFGGELSKPMLWLAAEVEAKTESLRHWVEALGGALKVHCEGDRLTVAANFLLGD